MPVAQFDQFEKLDRPIMGATAEADALWQRLSAEHDRYLDGFEDDLI